MDEFCSSWFIDFNFSAPEVFGNIGRQDSLFQKICPTELSKVLVLFYSFKGYTGASHFRIFDQDKVY